MATLGVVAIMIDQVSVTFHGDNVSKFLKEYEPKGLAKMAKIAKNVVCPALEAYAKENAPWTDITGNARNSLSSNFHRPEKNVFITDIKHGVDYGIHLENMQSGRFSICRPTVRNMTPKVLEMYMDAWRK